MGYCTFKDGNEKFIMTERDCLDVVLEYCGKDFFEEVRDYFETTVYETLGKINELTNWLDGTCEALELNVKELEKRMKCLEFEDEDEGTEFNCTVEEIHAKVDDLKGYLSELEDYLYEEI